MKKLLFIALVISVAANVWLGYSKATEADRTKAAVEVASKEVAKKAVIGMRPMPTEFDMYCDSADSLIHEMNLLTEVKKRKFEMVFKGPWPMDEGLKMFDTWLSSQIVTRQDRAKVLIDIAENEYKKKKAKKAAQLPKDSPHE